MAKREVCPTCKGCGHVIVLNRSEKCPKCKATGFVKPEPQQTPAAVSASDGEPVSRKDGYPAQDSAPSTAGETAP